MNENQQIITNWLEAHVEGLQRLAAMQDRSIRGISDHYFNMEDFILKEGRFFEGPSSRTGRYVRRPKRACFHNSYLAAVASKGKLRYCEGYAFSTVFPMLHGWNLDEDDRVVDTTWDDGKAYCGVVIGVDYLREMRKRTGECSAIDNWHEQWPLLQQPFKEEIYAV